MRKLTTLFIRGAVLHSLLSEALIVPLYACGQIRWGDVRRVGGWTKNILPWTQRPALLLQDPKSGREETIAYYVGCKK